VEKQTCSAQGGLDYFFFVVLYCKSLINCKAVHENVLVIFMQLYLSHGTGITAMALQFSLDPAGRVLLWSRPSREATLVAPSYPFSHKKKKLYLSHVAKKNIIKSQNTIPIG
jgi:hypothetical protein